ncbi:hypothetical protein BC833DRAFT_599176 [Globomyces pollinis-pini]|nr:hypothetical protein BC833DRAFT_599176 [Globomyces pollinis-pini]
MLANILVPLFVANTVLAQSCSIVGKSTDDFQKCLNTGLTSNTGRPTKTPEEACDGLKEVAWQFYGCLCIKEKVVVQCYKQYCPTDPSWSAFEGAQVSYCASADSNPIPAGQTIPGISNVTIPQITTGAAGLPTPTGKPNGAVDASTSFALIAMTFLNFL